MASEEHLRLSNEIKKVHKILRQNSRRIGHTQAWTAHLQKKRKLASYAQAMKKLALEHWEQNNSKAAQRLDQRSRIEWTIAYCRSYFTDPAVQTALRAREERILIQSSTPYNASEFLEANAKAVGRSDDERIVLLDVGSCYNPFGHCADFDVCAVDIAPAVETVYKCDFLNANVVANGERGFHVDDGEITAFAENAFDVVVFSLLLEYMPTSEQRVHCCEKAYQLLKKEGILIIITPDSRHCGVNAPLMKTWRYTLSRIGFNRIRFEKLEHITCMVFRKCWTQDIGQRWSELHKQPYMEHRIEIPQDSNAVEEEEDDEDSEAENDVGMVQSGVTVANGEGAKTIMEKVESDGVEQKAGTIENSIPVVGNTD